MLGWSFSLEEVNTRERIDYWEGGLFSDGWLQKAVENQDAIKVSSSGGYPDLYLIKTKILAGVREPVDTKSKWLYVEVWDQS